MRTIKFRGKRVDTKEWVYGSLDTNFTLEGIMTISFFDIEGFYCEEKVIPETVGQFTGLTDKNGKEIYEGDIVACEYCDFDQADDGRCYLISVAEYKQEEGMFRLAWFKKTLINVDRELIEVIGNVHENPELLK